MITYHLWQEIRLQDKEDIFSCIFLLLFSIAADLLLLPFEITAMITVGVVDWFLS